MRTLITRRGVSWKLDGGWWCAKLLRRLRSSTANDVQYCCQWVAAVLQVVRTSAGDNSVKVKIWVFLGDILRGKAFCHHCYHLCYHYNFLSNLLQTNHLLILVIAVIAKTGKFILMWIIWTREFINANENLTPMSNSLPMQGGQGWVSFHLVGLGWVSQ